MLSELRTTSLTPKNYYSLYLDIERKLQFIEDFFYQLLTKKNSPLKIHELYERVQYIGNIVPRLYLMITIGSLYIRLQEKPAEVLIQDLVEMCKGVQNPTRGLFLRLYMTHKLKDKLPDKSSVYGADYESTIKYLLTNFKDTVNLFCRLKGDWRGEKRERERSQLKSLIGQNLEGLSHLEALTTEVYRVQVLPVLLETIIKYKDVMSQEYLMLCVVSAFPDEFHLATLETLLDACTKLQYDVDLKTILIQLMDRLKAYARNFPQSVAMHGGVVTHTSGGEAADSSSSSFDIVALFSNFMRRIEKQKIDATDMLDIQNSLLGLSMTIHRNEVRFVNEIVDSLAEALPPVEKCLASTTIQEKIVSLLVDTILRSFDTVLSVLEINRFTNLMNLLNYENRKFVSNQLVIAVLQQDSKLSHWEHVSKFFALIDPLLRDQEDAPPSENASKESQQEFVEEQNRVALLVFQCQNEDTDILFRIYASVRKGFGRGGERRIQYTLVPLIYAYLQLVERVSGTGEQASGKKATPERILEYSVQTLQVLSKFAPALTLTLYLSGSLCSDRCSETAYTVEMLSQAFQLYETLDSAAQYHQFFNNILSTLCELRNLDEENFQTYTTKACQNAATLLHKPQQCKGAALCSTLFWPLKANPVLQDKEKALSRLQRSLKIVKECRKPQQLPLLVEILNVYLYHFEYDNDLITHKFINGLLDLIRENLEDARSDDFGRPEMDGKDVDLATVESFFEQTREHIRHKKEERPDKYAPIEV
uniref:Vacuolar protein sorting-associated protein 35 n=1 Tax=Percolomonas cosmopolitus TaxID=63605 RepID=A0A7S1KNC8_9EUKA